jgi:DNA topoisomerase-1
LFIKKSNMSKNVLIVESPGKIKKIQSFLGNDFKVVASYGHIRDLAKGSSGIDKNNGFEPKYIVSSDKKDVVSGLKKLADKAETIYLAADNDREGEAIAWHVKEVLKQPESKFKRIIFTEITKKAIEEAIKNPIELNVNLVNAQQARRVLDRLVGFDLSPLLWKKVKPNLSAGRVQSVALRIIVEKEKEIKSFETSSDFKVVAKFQKDNQEFNGILDSRFQTKEESKKFLINCKSSDFIVESMEKKPGKRSSPAPFTTSTLQQAASSKLGFSLNRIMSAAQSLYEGGHITYMRTDSVTLSDDALNAIEKEINSKYGKEYSNRKAYKTKDKKAQEAHEAIRPVDFSKDTAGDSDDCRKLYNLIWKRTMASQMSDAKVEKTTIITKVSNAKEKFVTRGEIIIFDGFLKLHTPESQNDEDDDDASGLLPNLKANDSLNCLEIKASQLFKKPPMRYSEANIVKKLEDLGIGRPSTYASIISTIQKREYVEIKDIESTEKNIENLMLDSTGNIKEESKKESYGGEKKKLVPSDIGIMVTDYLINHFESVMDYGFTASVENDFDEIAKGNSIWKDVISNFYMPFQEKVKEASKEEGKISSNELGIHPETNKKIYAKLGKFGPMIQMGETTDEEKPKFVKIDKSTGKEFSSITLEEAIELLKWPRELGSHKEKVISVAIGKFGPYIKYDGIFVSIPENYSVETITYDEALELLKEKIKEQNNRVIKEFKSKGISVLNGKYGPYINKGKNNYKIPEYKDAKDLTLKDCEEIISSSKKKSKK